MTITLKPAMFVGEKKGPKKEKQLWLAGPPLPPGGGVLGKVVFVIIRRFRIMKGFVVLLEDKF